jgi:hypothetical protein
MRTSLRRRPRDAGVNQSAFVALLVAVILVVTTSLVAFGPAVGRTIADYLICQLLEGVGADCTSPPDGPGDGGGYIGPKGEDTITELTLPGDDCSVTRQHLEDLFPGGSFDSDQLTTIGANLPPGSPPTNVAGVDFHGRIRMDGCDLRVEIPDQYGAPDDVHSAFWRELGIQIAAGLLAVLIGGVADAILCSIPALFPAICGAMAGFMIGFFWNVFAPLFDKGHLSALDWVKALASGIIAAIPGGYGATRPIGKKLVDLFRKTPAVAEQARVTLPRWVVDNVGGDEAFDLAGNWGQDLADLFDSFELEDLASGAAP